MHRRKTIRDSLAFAVAQYVTRAGLMLRGVVAARLLGPEVYGVWNALLLIMDYGAQANLGTYPGIDQTAPGAIVKGDAQRLDRIKRAGLFNAIFLPTLFGLGCLIYFGRSGGRIVSFWGMTGVIGALLVVLLTAFSFVHLSILRAHERITDVSLWFMIQGITGVTLGLGLIPFIGAWGLLWGWLVGTIVATVNLRRRGGDVVPLAPRPSAMSLQLLRAGFPMYVYAASTFVTRSLDRVIIVRFVGTIELGYYSLAVMALTLLLYLPEAVSYVLYPKLLRTYHGSGEDPMSIWPRFDTALTAVTLLVPALCGVGYLIASDVAHWVLPQFLPGVPAMRIVCFGAGGLAMASLSAIGLMTLRCQPQLMLTSVGVTLLTAFLDLQVVRHGLGIQGVAWVTCGMYLTSGTLLLTFVLRGFRFAWSRVLSIVGLAVLPVFLSFALVNVIEWLVPWSRSTPVPQAIGRLALVLPMFLVPYLVIIRPLAHGLGLRQMLSELKVPNFWSDRQEGGSQ